MLRSKSHALVAAGLLTAIGLILPYLTSHSFGIPGTILLPMHLPILLCGCICGPRLGAICGVVVPIVSSLTTGMPVAYPMLPIMTVQLFAIGLSSGLLYQKLKVNVFLSATVSMLSGWALYGLAFAALLFAGNGDLRALSVTAAIVQGLPGIAIQLLLVPAVLSVLKRRLNQSVVASRESPAETV